MNFLNKTVLVGIVFLAFVVRLYKIDSPIADWHSWRQADTSAVSRNFVKYGFDLLHPRYDDLSNIASGKDNPMGYRFVEFPLYNSLVAVASIISPLFSIEIWGRLISVFVSLGSLILLYFLTKKYLGQKVALLTSFFFAFLPYNIYYSRVILPEPHLVFTTLGMLFFFDKWLEKENFFYWFLAVIFSASALLIKGYAVFIWPPLLYLAFLRFGWKMILNTRCILFFILSIVPLFLWRLWMNQYPEGIPAFSWLFNEGNIRFKGAFFRWIFAERIAKLIIGYWGIFLLVLGIILKPKKEGWLFYWWTIGMLLYVSVIAGGNVRHDYYQVFLVPIICIFLGKAAGYFLSGSSDFVDKKVLVIGYWLLVISMIAFSWYDIRTYYWINKPDIIEAGKAIGLLTPKEAKVIAPYGGDTAFLYQTNRQGWPQGFEIEDKIKKGASYYVNVNINDPETEYVMKNWQVIKKTDKYVIVKLK